MPISPLASILINNYNYGRFLGKAIDSALSQTYENLEVIVVDDGSTDGSLEIIASYGDRISSVLKKNGGRPQHSMPDSSGAAGKSSASLTRTIFLPPRKSKTSARHLRGTRRLAGASTECVSLTMSPANRTRWHPSGGWVRLTFGATWWPARRLKYRPALRVFQCGAIYWPKFCRCRK